ncbi:hypothetical protein GCM10010285_61260 [Streptomyces pseudogriseolus]|uniref:Uncharacterized protein n=1 Tax=Streptomyces pseudogriseolus TaxID=36817 RepID=A0ABQ2TJY6_STREZ|nr:hypothetical protein GCM10010285_61260 [Streptomyces rubiginosus]
MEHPRVGGEDRACATSSRWLSGTLPRWREGYGLSAQSFHPKISGERLYANSLERPMSDMGL